MTVINIGGDTRTQEDKIAQRIRKRMIEAGILIPGKASALRPYMHPDSVARTKAFLIKKGVITPKSLIVTPAGYSLKDELAKRPKRMCVKCRTNHWLCPCGVLE